MKNLKNSFKNLAQNRSPKASRGGVFKSLKKAFRRLKYLDKTKSRFFATLTIISLFCLYVGGTYSYYAITKKLNAATIAIANLKYELTSTNTNFKNNSITVAPGETLDLELNLKSLNNASTKYALDYINDDPNVTVYYVGQKEQNVEGTIAGLNSVITIQVEIKNDSSTNQTVDFNLRGGYIQNILNSNIVKGAPGILMARKTYYYTGKFWSQSANIKTVVFETEMNPKEDATYIYDVSDKQNKSVMSYLVPDTEDETKYTLYIQSNEKTYANPNSSYFFYNFTSLENIDGLENLNTSNVTNMIQMFNNCSNLAALDVSNFDTSNVTNMGSMFSGCSSLALLDVSNFDTSKVTSMGNMFYKCSSLTTLDVSNFDTSNVINMSYMFGGYVTSRMLLTEIIGINNFNTSNVTNMHGMFDYCNNLNSVDVSNFNTGNVTNMQSMFAYCNSLVSLDLSNFNTSNVTTMSDMFSGCSGLTLLDVSGFDTSKVINMEDMFNACNRLTTLNLSNFNTSNVTNMNNMFFQCNSLTTLDVNNFDTRNVTTMNSMFAYCNSLVSLDLSNFDTSKVISFYNTSYSEGLFSNCRSLTTLDISSFDTSNITNMRKMFYACNRLATLDVSNFDTSKVTDMSWMFNNCNNLTTLDVSNFDTSKVTSMESMFNVCNRLTTLDLSNFDTSNVTNMSYMFSNCNNLTTIITIRGTKCTSYTNMFGDAASITGAQITVNFTEDASDLVDNMIATKSSTSNVVKAASPEPEYTITLNSDADITLSSATGYKFKEITLNSNLEGYLVTSFKMNGQTIEGNSFKMPAENVTITDIVVSEATIVESEHNPYANNINNQEYLNKTWDGATSLTVVLEYQTESINYDWVYLYDKDNKAYGKYGGTTKKTETITIPGDTLRIVFRTDGSGNNYYGFKATITPNY